MTPTTPARSSGSSSAEFTRSTRGHPVVAATWASETVFEEFAEPMTTTESHRPAIARNAAWRFVVA